MDKWADGDPPPNGAALAAAGYTGVWGYVGTPGRQKSATPAMIADWHAHGLTVGYVYENTADDIHSGAGAAHAVAALSGMVGARPGEPLAYACDEHLTAAAVPVGVAYGKAFYDTARAAVPNPIGPYGFSEYTTACRAAGIADFVWQCGSASALWAGVNFWQDNSGYDTVAGQATDRDWVRVPIARVNGSAAEMANSNKDLRITTANGMIHAFGGYSVGSDSAYFSEGYVSARALYGSGKGLHSARVNFIKDDGTSVGGPTIELPWNHRWDMKLPDGTSGVTIDVVDPGDGTELDAFLELASR